MRCWAPLAGAPRGAYAALVKAANDSGKPIVSADVPSGLDADTGEVYEPCIQARVTVCFALLKRGLVQYPGASAAGRIVVRAIGIPTRLAPEHGPSVRLLTDEVLRDALRVDTGRLRAPDGHKGTYGHVLLAAGSLPMSGAGLLSAKAALRAGCGLATWALPAALLPHVIGTVPELMLAAAVDGDSGEWNAASASAVLRLAESRDVLATARASAASRATQTGFAVCGNIRIVRSSLTRTPSTCWQTRAHMGLATGASEVRRQS